MMALEQIESSDINKLYESLALLGANLATVMGGKRVTLDQFRVDKKQAKPKRQSINAMKANICGIVAAHNRGWNNGAG